MCGRFTLRKQKPELRSLFELQEIIEELRPRYNIAPSQNIPVIALKGDGVTRGLAQLEWGFLPEDAALPKSIRPKNARGESVHYHPMFERAFREKRCLIPADGFYEWITLEPEPAPPHILGKRKPAKPKPIKLPYHFKMKDDSAFAFAGLWDLWKGEGKKIFSTCFITTKPNAVMEPVHDRMPVIVPREHYAKWLDFETPEHELRSMIRPYAAEPMEAFRVSRFVNQSKIDSPECLSLPGDEEKSAPNAKVKKEPQSKTKDLFE